jgi:hypothetical protein
MKVDQLMRCNQNASTLSISARVVSNSLNSDIAPFLAIVATQSGHTTARMAEFNERFCPMKGDPAPASDYIVLSLCGLDNNTPLSLNWVMPTVTLNFFKNGDSCKRTLAELCGNNDELGRYRQWLGHK